MTSVKNFMLDKAITWILGGDIFDRIKEIVAGLMNVDASGEEKREKAIREAKKLGADVATFLINLGIEAAVFLLKSQQQSKAA